LKETQTVKSARKNKEMKQCTPQPQGAFLHSVGTAPNSNLAFPHHPENHTPHTTAQNSDESNQLMLSASLFWLNLNG
jgi:hypothetical protein